MTIPGLKLRKRATGFARYFVPPQKDVKAGYRPRSIAFTPSLSDAEVAERCNAQWADLLRWRAGDEQEGPQPYTIAWLIRRYQADEHSPYKALRGRTVRSYDTLCRLIDTSIGKLPIEKFHGDWALKSYRAWGKPDKDGQLQAPSTARHAITMLRTLARYAVIIGAPGARDFKLLLSEMEFPAGKPRSIAPSRADVLAIVDQAEKDGYLSIAIATLAQFELVERRTHIIGYFEGKQWRPGWTWGDIGKDWIIRYYQSKVGLVLREFDLKDTPRLLALLDKIPDEHRVGPVVTMERQRVPGLRKPWNERHFAEIFRQIARRAGVSDDVWSMDMRAGGATEADSIEGVDDRDLKAAGGWKSDMHNRYTRAPQRRAAKVVKLRQAQARIP